MNKTFEINIRIAMVNDIAKEQTWIAKVKEKFPNMPKQHLNRLNNDNDNLIEKKAEIQAEIDELKNKIATLK